MLTFVCMCVCMYVYLYVYVYVYVHVRMRVYIGQLNGSMCGSIFVFQLLVVAVQLGLTYRSACVCF